MKIKILSLMTFLFVIFFLGVNAQAIEKNDIKVRVIMATGIPAVSMAGLIESEDLNFSGYDVDYEVLENPSLLAGKLVSGDADLAVVPTNLAIKLFNKGVDVKYAGGVVWGILYIITQESVKDWSDLKGKEIYSLGRGLTPDIVLRYLLTKNGLDPEKDVSLRYVSGTTELAPLFIVGKSKTSIIPEPALSMVMTQKPDTQIAMDLQKEWTKATKSTSSYPQASLVVLGDFTQKHPDFVQQFTAAYAESIDRLNADPATGGKLASKYLPMPSAAMIAKAIPRANLKWVSASEAREPMETYLKVLFDFSSETIGGEMPNDDFYLKE
jgi:NitT/TauT family transport system substrate-binding protein